MYCQHFGFSEKPFELTPDPRFLYQSPSHREAFASMVYGIQERRGIILLLGEVGTGKTTLLNGLADHLDSKVRVARTHYTRLSFPDILNLLLKQLGLLPPDKPLSPAEGLARLDAFAREQYRQGGNVVLIIDEAQNLGPEPLEELRLISNCETSQQKLIQIMLAGQPELEQILRQPSRRQLAQRISLRRRINPLTPSETDDYIVFRLGKAGCLTGHTLFSRGARDAIWQYSLGIPRKINILCDNSLLIAYGSGVRKIHRAMVAETADDLGWVRPEVAGSSVPLEIGPASLPRGYRRFEPFITGLAAACALLAMLLFGLGWMRAYLPAAPFARYGDARLRSASPPMADGKAVAQSVPVPLPPSVAGTLPPTPPAIVPHTDVSGLHAEGEPTEPQADEKPPGGSADQDMDTGLGPAPSNDLAAPEKMDIAAAPATTKPTGETFSIQVATFLTRSIADRVAADLAGEKRQAVVVPNVSRQLGEVYQVRIEDFGAPEAAAAALADMREHGFTDAYIIKPASP